jgi:2-methylisocitrate lyase-like PEP mutase family enzyme
MTNSSATAPPEHPATVLRRKLEDPNGFVLAPGVYDGLSARVALEVGFDALYMVSPPATSAPYEHMRTIPQTAPTR